MHHERGVAAESEISGKDSSLPTNTIAAIPCYVAEPPKDLFAKAARGSFEMPSAVASGCGELAAPRAALVLA